MKRNKKEEIKKEFLKLINHYDELRYYKRNPKSIELDEPIHHGYEVYWEVNQDILNTKLGEEIQAIVKYFGYSSWSKDKSFLTKSRKGVYYPIKPRFKRLFTDDLYKYQEWVRKWLEIDYSTASRTNWFGETIYELKFKIPSYYLEVKKRKSFITHKEILDPDLNSEIDQLYNLLMSDKFYHMMKKNDYGDPNLKYLSKIANRKDRYANKRILKNNLISENEKEFMYNHKRSWLRYWW